ncbi:hypothetical protein RUND412_005784 [Rhizina undulata]
MSRRTSWDLPDNKYTSAEYRKILWKAKRPLKKSKKEKKVGENEHIELRGHGAKKRKQELMTEKEIENHSQHFHLNDTVELSNIVGQNDEAENLEQEITPSSKDVPITEEAPGLVTELLLSDEEFSDTFSEISVHSSEVQMDTASITEEELEYRQRLASNTKYTYTTSEIDNDADNSQENVMDSTDHHDIPEISNEDGSGSSYYGPNVEYASKLPRAQENIEPEPWITAFALWAGLTGISISHYSSLRKILVQATQTDLLSLPNSLRTL